MHLRAVAAESGPAGAGGIESNQRPASPAVLRAVELIRRRYAERLTLDELTSDVHIGQIPFCRVFPGEPGLTPGRFFAAARLFEAKRLLLTTPLGIADIVSAVGSPSVGAFTNRFSPAVGLSPDQYRDPA